MEFSTPKMLLCAPLTMLIRFWVPPGSIRLTVLPWATLKAENELKALVLRMVVVVMSVIAPWLVRTVWVCPSVRMIPWA